MRYRTILSTIPIIAIAVGACKKEFLQMPVSNATTVDSAFSTTVKAQGAIANAYRNALGQGLPWKKWWNAMVQENLSGGMNYGFSWTMSRDIVLNGLSASGTNEDMDGYGNNFPPIRQAWLVKENIDKVTDMSDADKAIVKGEMQALVAYRYEQMFIMYGGVPIVGNSLKASDSLGIPRNPLQQVLDSIVSWCDQAAAVLPSKWADNWSGRMTKAAALAIKSKALLHAARPLFNSATPYLNMGENNNLICLGNADASRWTTAANAAEAVITEAESRGGAYIINTGNPLDDYSTATSVPANAEVLLAFKFRNDVLFDAGNWNNLPMNAFYNSRVWEARGNVLTTNQLENYYKANGDNQSWPDANTTRAFNDYTTRMNQMEARFKSTFQPWEMDAWNNPGDANWKNASTHGEGTPSFGCARVTKFYAKAGGRAWFEFPIFRLAAVYLSAAEAWNEAGQTSKALDRLNKIRQRAGIPAITETDQTKLRAIIQREWAVEFYHENYRLHDVKHWKLANIANGILGGPIRAMAFNSGGGVKLTGNTNYTDKVIYTAMWAPKQYLNPFPQTEINKKYLIQNPGY